MISSIDVIIRLCVAFLCGIIIGIERQLNNRTIGIHTNVLVCVGSCLFIFVGFAVQEQNSPSRIAAQVVTGIGFLGSGIIVKDNMSIKGINTAATVWCSAAIGCLCGSGFWLTGLCSSCTLACSNYILRDSNIKTILRVLGVEETSEETNN